MFIQTIKYEMILLIISYKIVYLIVFIWYRQIIE